MTLKYFLFESEGKSQLVNLIKPSRSSILTVYLIPNASDRYKNRIHRATQVVF